MRLVIEHSVDSNYPEGNLWLVEYFDVNGDYICTYFHESIAGPDDFHTTFGSFIKKEDGTIQIDTIYKMNFPEQKLVKNKLLFKTYFKNTNDLIKYLNISGVSELIKSDIGICSFTIPGINSIVRVTGNDVVLRDKPDKSGKLIKVLNTGNIVKIVSINKKDNIEGLGTFLWYGIIDESGEKGYIFGKYLDYIENK